MHNITDYILCKTDIISPEPEVTASENYQMFNSGGVEVEVAEFLYSLVRLWKPNFVLETGTHLGISALYMALGCEHNSKGIVETYEVIKSLQQRAIALWKDLGITSRIKSQLISSLSAQGDTPIDVLFLDSEPQFRFDEFIKFWPRVREGGIIAIHDLHSSLGRHGQVYHGVEDWPYGNWESKLGRYVQDFKVQMIHLPSPRGMTLMQKTSEVHENIRFLRSKYA